MILIYSHQVEKLIRISFGRKYYSCTENWYKIILLLCIYLILTDNIKCFFAGLRILWNWTQAPISHCARWISTITIAFWQMNQGDVIYGMFPRNIFILILSFFNAILQNIFLVIWMFRPIDDNVNHKCLTRLVFMIFFQ